MQFYAMQLTSNRWNKKQAHKSRHKEIINLLNNNHIIMDGFFKMWMKLNKGTKWVKDLLHTHGPWLRIKSKWKFTALLNSWIIKWSPPQRSHWWASKKISCDWPHIIKWVSYRFNVFFFSTQLETKRNKTP